jgi:hypothetical protein
MYRRFTFVTGIIGALALVAAGTTVELKAQRGARGAHGRPPSVAGNPGQGRPSTPGSPAAKAPHAPASPKADHPDSDTHPGKATGTGGRPTVGDQLTRNTNLTTRLQGLFPAGTDLQKASAGFKNLGQFVAAAHVSHNLDIPFDTLKARMTGTKPVSLGGAIQELKPTADAKTEAQKAEKAANAEIRDSGRRNASTAS